MLSKISFGVPPSLPTQPIQTKLIIPPLNKPSVFCLLWPSRLCTLRVTSDLVLFTNDADISHGFNITRDFKCPGCCFLLSWSIIHLILITFLSKSLFLRLLIYLHLLCPNSAFTEVEWQPLIPSLHAYLTGARNTGIFLWFLLLLFFFLARKSHALARKNMGKALNCGIWRQEFLILDPSKPFMSSGPWFPHPCSGDEELNSLEGPCQLWGTVFYHLQFLSNTKLIYGASEMFFLFSLLTSTHLSSKVSLLSPTQTLFPVPDSLYLASFPPLQPRICVLMYKFILIIGTASASVFSWSFQRASVSCLSYSIQPLHWWPVGSF